MSKYRMSVWVGPTEIKLFADLFRQLGLAEVLEGTEHVYCDVTGSDPEAAKHNLLATIYRAQGTDYGLHPVVMWERRSQEYAVQIVDGYINTVIPADLIESLPPRTAQLTGGERDLYTLWDSAHDSDHRPGYGGWLSVVVAFTEDEAKRLALREYQEAGVRGSDKEVM